MGQLASKVIRKANRFNVENRAHRVLEREKPTPAPKFDSNLRDMERTLELDPKFVDKLNAKDATLDSRLKDVYVTSQDRFIKRVQERQAAEAAADTKEERVLPKDRKTPEDFEYGYLEPTRVTPGRCTLRQALQFINDHQLDPESWPVNKIANEYKLKEPHVENILHYFKTFNVYIPDQKYKDTLLTQAKQQFIENKSDSSK
ncbi:uncharacterized protein Dana_GF17139 [Drosophila ananassae]|uniref:Protein NDUFAF4 homolog n=1 Tax=Drosophila ananassae TaxID=7217 RepID=B3M1E9_DROAN|nr:protein NDUFAF4 homolog [Drosophila ananassae]EDV42176.1 uncharacterized protein Dana_GF17139 [Drosophila ananassae]